MQLLGKLAVGGFDLRLARSLGNPQNGVGVAHPRSLRRKCPCPPADTGESNSALNVGFRCLLCNAPSTTRASAQTRKLRPLPGLHGCLLYTSDAADDLLCVDLGG